MNATFSQNSNHLFLVYSSCNLSLPFMLKKLDIKVDMANNFIINYAFFPGKNDVKVYLELEHVFLSNDKSYFDLSSPYDGEIFHGDFGFLCLDEVKPFLCPLLKEASMSTRSILISKELDAWWQQIKAETDLTK